MAERSRNLQDLADKYAELYAREPVQLRPRPSNARGDTERYIPLRRYRYRRVPQFGEPKDLPFEYFQGAIVQCPLTFVASLMPALMMAQFVETSVNNKRKLNSFASVAIGHSQGIASGACLTMGLYPSKVAVALLRQGQLQQELVGISHFVADPENKRPQTSGMVGLRGPPHACLQKGISHLPVALINDEANVVCSGELAPELLYEPHFKGMVKRTVRCNALAIPAPNHSRHLEPALMRLLADSNPYAVPLGNVDPEWDFDSEGQDLGGAFVGVVPTSPDVRKIKGARETWRSVCEQQMVLKADFPSSVVHASSLAGGEDSSTMLDFGPLPVSIAASLVRSAKPRFTITPSVVPSLEDEVRVADPSRSLVVPHMQLELQKAFTKARVRYGDRNFERVAVQRDSGMGHTASDLSVLMSLSKPRRLPGSGFR